MSGLGLFSAGLGPFGIGTPDAPAAIPAPGAGSRYINPASRDYQQDASTRQLAQMPGVRQRVLLALTTLLGSSTAVRDFGTRRRSKMGTTYDAEVRADVTSALRQLVEVEKIVVLESISVQRGGGGRSLITVSYRDLTIQQSESVTVNG